MCVLLWVTTAMIKHHDQKQFGEEKKQNLPENDTVNMRNGCLLQCFLSGVPGHGVLKIQLRPSLKGSFYIPFSD